MRIAINGWFWGALATGSGQYLQHVLTHLRAHAEECELILCRPALQRQQHLSSPLPTHWLATPFDRIHRHLAKLWYEQVAFPLACRRLGCDAAWVPYWGSPGWAPCAVVVTIHDLIPLLQDGYRGGLFAQAYTALVARTAGRARLILADSEATRQDVIRHLHVPAHRVRTVRLAASPEYRRVQDPEVLAAVRARYQLPPRFLLYLGGFDRRKNVPAIVYTFAQMRTRAPSSGDVHLVLAGALPLHNTDFTPDPQVLVRNLGLEEWVHTPGWIEERDKPALYSLAEGFVFPSEAEGFGLMVLEAMACGCPVITSNGVSRKMG